nr:type III-A CRISPR-associated RAMP protein Csm3 [Candidatus Sigynarchaeum springense]
MSKKWLKNIVFTASLVLETGLHIGGLKESVGIGGVDNPVIRTTRQVEPGAKAIPYIPGSSLKGKLRSLLELKYTKSIIPATKGKVPEGYLRVGSNFIDYGGEGKATLIPVMFGIPADEEEGTGESISVTRLQVRDAFPSKDTIDGWSQNQEILDGTEVKAENSIDRVTSAANPRFFERVPAGARFDLEIVMAIFEGDDEAAMTALLKESIAMLEDNYLGGMGSRGYGKVRVQGFQAETRDEAFYSRKIAA